MYSLCVCSYSQTLFLWIFSYTFLAVRGELCQEYVHLVCERMYHFSLSLNPQFSLIIFSSILWYRVHIFRFSAFTGCHVVCSLLIIHAKQMKCDSSLSFSDSLSIR